MLDIKSPMNTTLTNTRIKPIEAITGKANVSSGLTVAKKVKMIARHLNPSRYEFVGFVDRTNGVVLRERFYNVRDKQGRFAAVVEA
jgi:hypothetical protein